MCPESGMISSSERGSRRAMSSECSAGVIRSP